MCLVIDEHAVKIGFRPETNEHNEDAEPEEKQDFNTNSSASDEVQSNYAESQKNSTSKKKTLWG